ncbi:MAG: hypothetical protein CMP49_05875 [Flavobacteriales bacterium]|nr:hypothetical protein [Flavobacteriales bacterium]|tara:strand:- start:9767 stop:11068 length:1302 start_codon:yes stop_codon:yes gene_type:complete
MKNLIVSIILFTTIYVQGQKIELIESFIGYTEKSEIISFTPNPKLIMSGNYKGSLNLWDLEQEKLIKTIDAHKKFINNITFHRKKNLFLTCSQDSTIKLWSFYSNKILDSLKIQHIPTLSFFRKKNNNYFVCTNNGLIFEKNPKKEEIIEIINLDETINDALLTEDETRIITCDKESIKTISLENGEIINEIKNPYSSHFLKIEIYSTDTLITWSENGIISYWDLNQQIPITEIRAKNAYNKLLINSYSEIILSGYYNDRPLVINLKEIELEKKYSENMIVVNTFLSSLDQEYLVSADVNDRHRLMTIREVDFSPLVIQERKLQDEKVFEISSRYVLINIWDDEKIDGDTLSINFNGKWVLKDYHLIKEEKTILLPLKKNEANEIIFHAENLGSIPPNTAAVRLEYDNGTKKEFNMRSDFDANGIIKLIQKDK